ncbi:MAG: PKD domain-containing protein, partial [Flavobacteriales bacterium]|nr:PKD domain-containing protein [Flavobacteriales bacterium]
MNSKASCIYLVKKQVVLLLLAVTPLINFATHIVGGFLTYEHIGGNDYTITLTVYRDCSGTTLSNDEDVLIYYDSNGDYIVDENDTPIVLDVNRISDDVVPSVLDTCVEVTTSVCVEEHIYVENVTLPTSNTGYHLFYERYARNDGIVNLDFDYGDTGEGWYNFIPSPTTYIYGDVSTTAIWFEDFEDRSQGDITDNGATAWDAPAIAGADHFEVRNSGDLNGSRLFEGEDTDSPSTWESEYVDISTAPGGVNLSVLVKERQNNGNDDYIDVYYLKNDEPAVLFNVNGHNEGNFSNATASHFNLIADSVAIRIVIENDRNGRKHQFDDVTISSVAIPIDTILYGDNSSPVFDSLPPPYLCAYKAFTFDHKATDPDGDSLVYSLCTPYDDWENSDVVPPPFKVANTPQIPRVQWGLGYSSQSPMDSLPVIWHESFPNANATSDVGPPSAWTRDVSAASPDHAETRSNGIHGGNYFETKETDGEVKWESEVIDISGVASAGINVDLFDDFTDALDANDSILVYYNVDGAGEVLFPINGQINGSFYWSTAEVHSIVGNSLVITVKMYNDENDEKYAIDDICVYDATSPTISIDSETGLLSGTPGNNTIDGDEGRFVVGVCVEEYRNGIYYGRTVRDFQFNTVYCPDAARAIVDSTLVNDTLPVCSGLTAVFPNHSDDSNNWHWDFGDITEDPDDTSTFEFPTWTYPALGSYIVELIINDNTACADTDTVVVTISTFSVGFSSALVGCEDIGIAFTDTSSGNNGTPNSWSWDFGDGGTSTSQNPTYTYPDPGTFTVKLIVGTDAGCLDSVSKVIVIDDQPTAEAGPGQTKCGNNAITTMAGASISVASTAIWTSGGTGTFNDATDLNAVYTPGLPADTLAGSVVLTLSTTDNGNCPAGTDFMTITLTDAPTVVAGGNQSVCGDIANVTMTGASFTGASTAVWTSSGTGTFDDDNSLTAVYTGTSADTSAGVVTLTLTTLPYGSCASTASLKSVFFTDGPSISAGTNQTVCGLSNVTVTGTSNSVVTAGTWTSSSAGTFDTPNAYSAIYTPTAIDTGNGSVLLTFTSTAQSGCNPTDSSITVTISDAPHLIAGNDTTICANNGDVTLSAQDNGVATAWQWSSSSGDGTFDNEFALSTSYHASNTDTTNGSVTITIASTAQGGCSPDSDFLVVTITDAPTVEAGPNVTVCGNNANITLTGLSTVATAVLWSNGAGDGTFDDATAANAVYTPGSSDISLGTVILTLNTTAQGKCTAVSDFLTLTISPSPTVDAGLGQTVCGNNGDVSLTGISNAVATAWLWTSSSGDGTFDSNTSLSTTYHPSITDTGNGNVTLTLTSTAQGTCLPTSDIMIVTITDAPNVSAGPGQTVCANNVETTLQGTSNS